MLRQTLKVLGLAVLLISPTVAQFGIGKKKQKTSFEELQKQAAAAGGGDAATHHVGEEMADMAKLQEMFAGAFQNPEAMAGFGDDIQKAMDELAKMDPAELQEQVQQAMAAMTSGDMVENLINQKDEVLKNLQESGMVSAEELEKYKNDPVYFESQMRGAFQEMQGMFSDPKVLQMAGETMKGMQQAFSDPAIANLNKLMEGGEVDDTKIEEARLQLLQDPEIAENPVFKALFDGDEFQEMIRDPKKWRESFKEGQQMLNQAGGGLGGAGAARVAGHGEL